MASKADLHVIIRRINGLLAKAESSTFPEEKAACYAKAEKLQREYRVEEEQLIAEDITAIAPIKTELELCGYYSDFKDDFLDIMWIISRHCEIEIAYRGKTVEGRYMVMAHLVGYEGDIRMAEFLFTAARKVHGERIEPVYDPSVPEREMIYRLRQSGIERQRVARMMWGEEIGSKSSAHAKVGRIYKEECLARGEAVALDGRGISLKDYRKSYSQGFINKLSARLRDSRNAVDGTFGALNLHGRKERVKEAFYTFFPSYRPAPPSTEVEVVEEKKEKKAVAKPAKERRITAKERRENARHWSAASMAGRAAGQRAASEVELTRQPRTGKINEGEPTRESAGEIGR